MPIDFGRYSKCQSPKVSTFTPSRGLDFREAVIKRAAANMIEKYVNPILAGETLDLKQDLSIGIHQFFLDCKKHCFASVCNSDFINLGMDTAMTAMNSFFKEFFELVLNIAQETVLPNIITHYSQD